MGSVLPSVVRPSSYSMRGHLGRGGVGPPEFKRVADAQRFDGAIRLQEDVVLAVVTDGEMRPFHFQSQLTDTVEGFSE